MTTRQKLGLGLAGAGAFWWLSRRSGDSLYAFPSFLTGQRVTRAEAGTDGFVAELPADLARTATGGPYDLVTYSL
ncbi:MAG: hypothetical protein AABY22_14880, partial [Nanoarchaeota archaeon]